MCWLFLNLWRTRFWIFCTSDAGTGREADWRRRARNKPMPGEGMSRSWCLLQGERCDVLAIRWAPALRGRMNLGMYCRPSQRLLALGRAMDVSRVQGGIWSLCQSLGKLFETSASRALVTRADLSYIEIDRVGYAAEQGDSYHDVHAYSRGCIGRLSCIRGSAYAPHQQLRYMRRESQHGSERWMGPVCGNTQSNPCPT